MLEHNYEETRPVDPRMYVNVKFRNGRVKTARADEVDWSRVKSYEAIGYEAWNT